MEDDAAVDEGGGKSANLIKIIISCMNVSSLKIVLCKQCYTYRNSLNYIPSRWRSQ